MLRSFLVLVACGRWFAAAGGPGSHRVAFGSMCVATTCKRCVRGASQDHDLYGRCAASACSLLRFENLAHVPIVYVVDAGFPDMLRRAFDAHRVGTINATMDWPASPRFPAAPGRAYTFHKLNFWRLPLRALLFFDSDGLFRRDPLSLLHDLARRSVALAASKFAHARGKQYFNTGLVFLRSSPETYALLEAAWVRGAFKTWGNSDAEVTEQDVVIHVFSGALKANFSQLDVCANFRHARRAYQKECLRNETRILLKHGVYHFGKNEADVGHTFISTSTCGTLNATRRTAPVLRGRLAQPPGSLDFVAWAPSIVPDTRVLSRAASGA
mmetsp:Transcript_24332/g.82041  ORF Transcript_24332/g.82041 Transcript_24332/m.82041 type:complete len:327 (+) Transcript_24332:207-1187(+)